ncbi:MAG: GNAT family N-acetyltransferase [Acidimicrobiia bacterium]
MTDLGRISFRPLQRSDFPAVAAWFEQPHIARWWHESSDLDDIEAKYGPRVDGGDPTRMWIVEIDWEAAGLAQHYRHEDYPDHDEAVGVEHAVGIDYLLAEEFVGRGLGPVVLGDFARLALDGTPGAERCVATPAQANRASWTALERAGFRRRGACRPPDEPIAWMYVLDRASP